MDMTELSFTRLDDLNRVACRVVEDLLILGGEMIYGSWEDEDKAAFDAEYDDAFNTLQATNCLLGMYCR